MMFERTTQELRQVIVQAQQNARAAGDPEIDTEHLRVALLGDGGAFRDSGEPSRSGDEHQFGSRGLPFSAGAKKALELSLRAALSNGDGHIGVEHLRTALSSLPDRQAGGRSSGRVRRLFGK